jgi:hypothetical protein
MNNQSRISNFQSQFQLTQSQIDKASQIARERFDLHKNHDSNDWTDTSIDRDVIGIKAEITFADFYGLSVDETLKPDGDNGYDFKVKWNGVQTVDVKGTSYPYSPKLRVRVRKVNKADIYVLISVDKDTTKIHGWATSDMLRKAGITKSKYGHKNHEIENNNLRDHPPSHIISAL